MAFTIRVNRIGGWEADIRVRLPNGRRHRERPWLTVRSKTVATRWAEERERELLVHGLQPNAPEPEPAKKEVPTLSEFMGQFIEHHAEANQQKPSGINHKRCMFRVHLLPTLGSRRLDEITTQDVQHLKHAMRGCSSKTVNNALTVLNTTLKKAVEWGVIEEMPCTIQLLKTTARSRDFYSFAEYDRLVAAAAAIDTATEIAVLLAGDAGLRAGEIRALLQTDADVDTGLLRVERNEWHGQITTTKGGRLRYVPMTDRLRAALRAHRHLRGALMFGGRVPVTEAALKAVIFRAARRAQLRCSGPHMLRHTFCSHLAMRGVSPRAIQELAGHRDLGTTQRYMHLSPNATGEAIRALEARFATRQSGDIVATDRLTAGGFSRS